MTVALVVACGSALGATSPTAPAYFVVQPNRGHFASDTPALGLSLTFLGARLAPARISIYVPRRFELAPQREVGDLIGTAELVASDSVSFGASLTGREAQIRAASDDAAAEAAAQACSPGTHLALWSVPISLLGQQAVLPIYVADAGANGPPGAGLRLDLCPPQISSGTAAGFVPLEYVDLSLSDVSPPGTAGSYRWRAVVTPLGPGNKAGVDKLTYELESVVPVPQRLTLAGSVDAARRQALLRGKLVQRGGPDPRAAVLVERLVRAVTDRGVDFRDSFAGMTHLTRSGTWSLRTRLTKTTGFVASTEPSFKKCSSGLTPRGCLSLTVPGAESDPITLSVP